MTISSLSMYERIKKAGKNRVSEENLELWRSATYLHDDYKYNGKPFTGFAVLEYHSNGNISYELEYHEGQQLGWEVTYHENGKIERETLMYGATSIVFYEYDVNSKKLSGGFVAPKSLYNECARIIGIDEIDEDEK